MIKQILFPDSNLRTELLSGLSLVIPLVKMLTAKQLAN